MNIKYFDNYNGKWRDVEALQGDSLVYDISGFTTVNQKPYKLFVALISQADSDPVVNILQDEIGFSSASLLSTGQYNLTFNNPFNKSLTSVLIGTGNTMHNGGFTKAFVDNSDKIGITTFDDTYTLADDILYNTALEIKVYNITS